MSAKITGLSQFRVEIEWPCTIDIEKEYNSLLASVFLAPSNPLMKSWQGQQIKVLLKEGVLGLFVSSYPDADVPKWWRDAEIIWQYDQVTK